MKLRPYHSVIIFAVLMLSAIFSSMDSYHRTQTDIINDMDQALVLTIQENQHQWITPDTIQSYRSHLSIDLLKQTSNLCYVMEDEKRKGKQSAASGNGNQAMGNSTQLSSREMQLHQCMVQGYANCSMLDVFGMSNQRTSLSLTIMAMLWGIWSLYYYNRRKRQAEALALVSPTGTESAFHLFSNEEQTERWAKKPQVKTFGSLAYSSEEDFFFNQESNQTIKFTPMQHQLMQLFMQSAHHQLSKQEICEALWPKKPDASETLYTLIRRIKPIIERNSNLMIESERGRAYRLTEKAMQ